MSWTDAFIKRQVGKAPEYKRSRAEVEVMDDGVYRSYSNGVTVLTRKEMSFPESAKLGAGNGKEGITMLIPRIPFKYWLMTLDFYKDIFTKFRTEASVLFYWNLNDKDIPVDLYNDHKDGLIVDGKLVVYCPKQHNTSTRSTFKNDKLMDWFEKNYQCIVETHSHHQMDTFFSGVDNANELQPRCYGVFGRIIEKDEFMLRFCLNGKHALIEPTDVFILPKRVKRTKVATLQECYYVNEDGTEELYDSKPTDVANTEEVTGVYENNHTYPESWLKMNLSGKDHSPIYDSEDEANDFLQTAVTIKDDEEEDIDVGTMIINGEPFEDEMPDVDDIPDEDVRLKKEGTPKELWDVMTDDERIERHKYRNDMVYKHLRNGVITPEGELLVADEMKEYDTRLMETKGIFLAICPAKEEDTATTVGYTCHDDVKLR
ncbi:hypothetical protein [Bacillus mycoides]|uniref:hypothetical protein n=1 Tax=Bacillus mycoides TaxID=1405 RepID=UPI003A7FDB4A